MPEFLTQVGAVTRVGSIAGENITADTIEEAEELLERLKDANLVHPDTIIIGELVYEEEIGGEY